MELKYLQFRVVPVDEGPLNKQWYGEIMWVGRNNIMARESGGFDSPALAYEWIRREIDELESQENPTPHS